MVNRFDAFLVNLDPQASKDAKNTRPCVVISPDEMNRHISTVLIAPLSAAGTKYPTRVPLNFLGGERVIVLDQLRAVDKERLVKKIGRLEATEQAAILECLAEIFAE